MKFTVTECDAVQLCRDAKMMVEMQDGNAIHLEFYTDLDVLPIKVDSGRFMKLLSSVLSVSGRHREMAWVDYTLSREAEMLKIAVHGSPLFRLTEEEEQSPGIQHDINRLFLETFNGSYILEKEGHTIVITYPI